LIQVQAQNQPEHERRGPAAAAPRLEAVRRLTSDLQAQIDEVARAARAVDGGVTPFGEHKWLRLIRGDDRCAALVLWQGAAVVGAAHCDIYHTQAPNRPCRLTAELVVHPSYRGHGFGTLLVQGISDLAHEEGADELHLWAYGNLPTARRLAERMGYASERVLLQLLLPAKRLPAPPDVAAPGSGSVRLRAFEPRQDADPWLQLHNRVFAGHPEQGHWDASDVQARLEQPWFDPQDLLVAEETGSGRLLGFCWVKLPRDETLPGEIYIIGVDPDERGRGLGQLLTQAGLARIAARGRPSAMLFVEADNAAAVALYAKLGFARQWEHACYARPAASASIG